MAPRRRSILIPTFCTQYYLGSKGGFTSEWNGGKSDGLEPRGERVARGNPGRGGRKTHPMPASCPAATEEQEGNRVRPTFWRKQYTK